MKHKFYRVYVKQNRKINPLGGSWNLLCTFRYLSDAAAYINIQRSFIPKEEDMMTDFKVMFGPQNVSWKNHRRKIA